MSKWSSELEGAYTAYQAHTTAFDGVCFTYSYLFYSVTLHTALSIAMVRSFTLFSFLLSSPHLFMQLHSCCFHTFFGRCRTVIRIMVARHILSFYICSVLVTDEFPPSALYLLYPILDTRLLLDGIGYGFFHRVHNEQRLFERSNGSDTTSHGCKWSTRQLTTRNA